MQTPSSAALHFRVVCVPHSCTLYTHTLTRTYKLTHTHTYPLIHSHIRQHTTVNKDPHLQPFPRLALSRGRSVHLPGPGAGLIFSHVRATLLPHHPGAEAEALARC
jgi:hypothetical protein